jgi:hypothetical protein
LFGKKKLAFEYIAMLYKNIMESMEQNEIKHYGKRFKGAARRKEYPKGLTPQKNINRRFKRAIDALVYH